MDSIQQMPNVSNIAPGTVIAGRYEIRALLGAGGMGLVYLVVDRELEGEEVALKLLHPHLAEDESMFRRFRNEVLIARGLTHPNIVRLYDIGSADGGVLYLSMEFVQGESLKSHLGAIRKNAGETNKGMPFEHGLYVFSQILSGVAYAHERGVIHRDLKPANVLINGKGEVKLVDFGTARLAGGNSSLTQAGEIFGTPDYMSPEQIRGEQLGVSSDIYSLGIMAFEIMAGVRPFLADSPVALAYKHLHEPVPDVRFYCSEIPGWFQDCILKCCSKNPASRYGTAAEMMSDIQRYSTGGQGNSEHVAPAVLLRPSDFEWSFGDDGSHRNSVKSGEKKGHSWLAFTAAVLCVLALTLGIGMFGTDGVWQWIKELGEKHDWREPVQIVKTELGGRKEKRGLEGENAGPVLANMLPLEVIQAEEGDGGEASFSKVDQSNIPEEASLLAIPADSNAADESDEFSSSGEESKEPVAVLADEANAPRAVVSVSPVPSNTRVRIVTGATALQNLSSSEVSRGVAVDPPVANPVPGDSTFNRSSLELARGREHATEVIPPQPELPAPALAPEPNILRESFTGMLRIDSSDSVLVLDLEFAGEQIRGSGRIDGFGAFQAQGRVYPRGFEVLLSNDEHKVRLTGSRREEILRGQFMFAGEGAKRGSWEVRRLR